MRARNSVKCASWLITLMALFSMTTAWNKASEKSVFEVSNLTGSQTTHPILAHRGSGRIEFKVGQTA